MAERVGTSNNPDNDSDEEMMDFLAVLLLDEATCMKRNRVPQRTCPFTGQQYVEFLTQGHPQTIIDILRMDLNTFESLAYVLVYGGYLKIDKMRLSAQESLAIFLWVCGQKGSQRATADRFQHSTETICRHFKQIMRALCKLAVDIIQPPNANYVHSTIYENEQLYPWFKDCIGAIDGTLIDAAPPASRQQAFRARKDGLTQNVLAACDFEMKFTFLHTGWEGSAHDNAVLSDALAREEVGFPLPPANKFYLVDAGYTNMPGFLAPYRRTRYNMPEFRGVTITSRKELLNRRHSSLRTTIERAFGVLKKRFPILKMMPNYKPSRQGSIVMACCACHNWIRNNCQTDAIFGEIDMEVGRGSYIWQGNAAQHTVDVNMSAQGLAEMEAFRDAISHSMFQEYVKCRNEGN